MDFETGKIKKKPINKCEKLQHQSIGLFVKKSEIL